MSFGRNLVGITLASLVTIGLVLWFYFVMYKFVWLGLVGATSLGVLAGFVILFIVFIIISIYAIILAIIVYGIAWIMTGD